MAKPPHERRSSGPPSTDRFLQSRKSMKCFKHGTPLITMGYPNHQGIGGYRIPKAGEGPCREWNSGIIPKDNIPIATKLLPLTVEAIDFECESLKVDQLQAKYATIGGMNMKELTS